MSKKFAPARGTHSRGEGLRRSFFRRRASPNTPFTTFNGVVTVGRPGAMRGVPATEIVRSEPYRAGSMLRFLSVQTPSGMILDDLRLMAGRDDPWIAMRAGRRSIVMARPGGIANSKAIFSQIIEFHNRQIGNRFRRCLLPCAATVPTC
jgi:hypothetical protein